MYACSYLSVSPKTTEKFVLENRWYSVVAMLSETFFLSLLCTEMLIDSMNSFLAILKRPNDEHLRFVGDRLVVQDRSPRFFGGGVDIHLFPHCLKVFKCRFAF